MPRDRTRTVILLTLAAILGVVTGCARVPAEPRIQVGTPCATCGMEVQDLRFASLRRIEGRDRQYDSIECLLKDAGAAPRSGEKIYLPDYDEGRLHPVESLWVVKGDFPTPMGGGLAAFATVQSAQEVADRTNGCVGRYAEIAPGGPR